MKELQKQIIHIVTERLNKYGSIKRSGDFLEKKMIMYYNRFNFRPANIIQ